MDGVINFTTLLLSALSPLLVALLRRARWPDEVMALLAFAVVAVIYTAGRALDGALTWPLTTEYAIGLAAAFGAQQGVFQLIKRSALIENLAAVGDPAPAAPAAAVERATARGLAVIDTERRVPKDWPPVDPEQGA